MNELRPQTKFVKFVPNQKDVTDLATKLKKMNVNDQQQCANCEKSMRESKNMFCSKCLTCYTCGCALRQPGQCDWCSLHNIREGESTRDHWCNICDIEEGQCRQNEELYSEDDETMSLPDEDPYMDF